MKRSSMPARSKPLARGPAMGRTAGARGRAPARDWSEANAKLEAEGNVCRVGGQEPLGHSADHPGCEGPVQRAHIIGRDCDEPHPTKPGWLIVRAASVVPLCRKHHQQYDARRLDLLPYLSEREQAHAVLQAGGIVSALVRLSPGGRLR